MMYKTGIMKTLFLIPEDRATMGIDLSAGVGFTEESGTNAYHSFMTTSSPLSFGKNKAVNPGSRQSPVSRRLL